MKNTFIITAGGIGKRMGSTTPKQFLLIRNKPVLMHAIERFHEADSTAQIVITLPEDWVSYWNDLCQQHNFSVQHQIVSGGVERYDSIKNAIQVATGDIISIHDGVRPFVSKQTILNCIQTAIEKGNAIPYLPIKESIRKVSKETNMTVLRSDYVLIQTPQCFQIELIKRAYSLPFHEQITDDASLVEELGEPIHLVLGNEENIKITTPFDLKIGELLH